MLQPWARTWGYGQLKMKSSRHAGVLRLAVLGRWGEPLADGIASQYSKARHVSEFPSESGCASPICLLAWVPNEHNWLYSTVL